MRIFDTNVQKLKYDVLREVARHAYEDTLQDAYLDIPKTIAPGPEPTMRCCIYKERAIAAERVKLAMGGEKGDKNIIKIIDIACDECPVSTYRVTEDCRGCLAHRCEVQVAYAIGMARPVSVMVDTFGTECVPVADIERAIDEVFDLRPGAIIDDLDLRRPIYRKTAAYGHFGRELPDFTWEATDRAEALRKACGLE